MHAIRRPAAALGAFVAASVFAAAPAQAAAPARATGGGHGSAVGSASATTARLGLDVKLLNSTVDVPVDLSLNAIQAPGSQDGSLLTADVDGVGSGGPLTLVRAKLAHSSATADRTGAHALVDLVNARVDVPGLLGTGLITLDQVHAQADCPADGRPSARVDVLGDVGILGERVSLSAAGPTLVSVPGIGKVSLWLSRKTVGDASAAATALELQVSINPLQLNVAEVTGSVEIAAVSCHEGAGDPGGAAPSAPADPSGGPSSAPSGSAAPGSGGGASATPSAPASGTPSTGPSASPGSGSTAQPAAAATPLGGTTSLAETGGGSDAPMIGGVGLALLAAGAGGVWAARRRRS
ncbi:LPXTG cell wall anchor domain-containing protein [Streptacidiphilus sp. PB12-B1b]|uniref:SCO1860 family LAETG-anchored protein n=1 Tax=Streptacidiphilus sp. PB12-B1b TaxID=2705012 RepID=UPI0015FB40CB|nr:SCO1860 family LAETG-anchored protein [Streptacidiphilus sp. PB12-B1b]QMU78567.1 LPXTG cell wall anchor domain-containing protein [Streptacidiphilus sp. PB12-B1b]